ncbi:hypothetical protein GNI_014090 [Gregarina niphandrodes]|uniref:Uncharacterized protein n=1 Tax=Gregarina niphandrodes TaxID=110365 RepID=A0A023BCL4_GRENI|nr:hypothetical protein GNI_014090 [Gregarina niphandrodes]EZG83738.1 hypothetical protein GNI_014090 [Gregarina niphandrodes]|eukprot:XP_011128916.1 hypothetical protein GNI_014090 [Gregarina niphandrodes]
MADNVNQTLHDVVERTRAKILHSLSGILTSARVAPHTHALAQWQTQQFQLRVHVLSLAHSCRTLLSMASDLSVGDVLYNVDERRRKFDEEAAEVKAYLQKIRDMYLISEKMIQTLSAELATQLPPLPNILQPNSGAACGGDQVNGGVQLPVVIDSQPRPLPRSTVVEALANITLPATTAGVSSDRIDQVSTAVIDNNPFLPDIVPRQFDRDCLTTKAVVRTPNNVTTEEAIEWLTVDSQVVMPPQHPVDTYHSRLMLHP